MDEFDVDQADNKEYVLNLSINNKLQFILFKLKKTKCL